MDSDSSEINWEECLEEMEDMETDNRSSSVYFSSERSSSSTAKKKSVLECLAFTRAEIIPEIHSPFDKSLIAIISKEKYYLHALILQKNIDYLEEVLQSEASNLQTIINWQDSSGDTPLMLAVKQSPTDLNIIEILLDAQCDARKLDNSGRSPLEVAIDSGNIDLAKMLFLYLYESAIPNAKEVKSLLMKTPDFQLTFKTKQKNNSWKNFTMHKSGTKIQIKSLNNIYVFDGNLWTVDLVKSVKFNPYEQLDTTELDNFVQEYMKTSRERYYLQSLHKNRSCIKRNVCKKINGFNCEKYNMSLLLNNSANNTKSLSQSTPNTQRTPKPVFDYEDDQDMEETSELKTDYSKKKKASCWATKDFCFSSHLLIQLFGIFPLSPLYEVKEILKSFPRDLTPIVIASHVQFKIRKLEVFECPVLDITVPDYPIVPRGRSVESAQMLEIISHMLK